MSPRLSRWLLWAVFVVAIPVPLVSPLAAWVPAARVIMLAVISLLTIFVETTRGAVVALTFLLFLQAFVGIAVMWLAAFALSRLLGRLPPVGRAIVTAALVVAVFAATIAGSFYRDPYRSGTLRANLIEVYE